VCIIHVSAAATSRAHRERYDLEIVDVGELSQVRRIDGQVVDDRGCRDHRIKAHRARVPNPTRCNRLDDVVRMPNAQRTLCGRAAAPTGVWLMVPTAAEGRVARPSFRGLRLLVRRAAHHSARLLEETFNEARPELIDQLVAPDAINHDPATPAEMRSLRGPEVFKRTVSIYRARHSRMCRSPCRCDRDRRQGRIAVAHPGNTPQRGRRTHADRRPGIGDSHRHQPVEGRPVVEA
jgi:hypothetical protein